MKEANAVLLMDKFIYYLKQRRLYTRTLGIIWVSKNEGISEVLAMRRPYTLAGVSLAGLPWANPKVVAANER